MEDIYESRMNSLTMDELDEIEVDTIGILTKRLSYCCTKAEKTEINIFARRLAIIDHNTQDKSTRVIGVYYRPETDLWCATRKIGSKKHWIGSGRNKEEIELKMIEFSKQKGLEIFK